MVAKAKLPYLMQAASVEYCRFHRYALLSSQPLFSGSCQIIRTCRKKGLIIILVCAVLGCLNNLASSAMTILTIVNALMSDSEHWSCYS